MTQKLIRVGNSYAITISKKFLDALNFPQEGVVHVSSDEKKGKMVIDFAHNETEDVVDTEVYAVAKNLLKRYLPAFKELAKK